MVRSTPARPPVVPLTDDVITVRLRRAADLDAIAAPRHDPATVHRPDDTPMDAQAHRTSMARVEEAWLSGQATPLVIADAPTDQAVALTIRHFKDDETASVAYSVFPAHRDHGIAPRTVLLLTTWAFGGLSLIPPLLEGRHEQRLHQARREVPLPPPHHPHRLWPEDRRRTVAVFARRKA